MLSKLLHYESNINLSAADNKSLMSAVEDYYNNNGKRAAVTESFSKGTLGIFFRLILNGKNYFVKTHLPSLGHKTNLVKEIMILEYLYRDVLEIHRVDLKVEDYEYTFLIMDELKPLTVKPTMDVVNQLITNYNRKLKCIDISKQQEVHLQLENTYKISNLQEKSTEALDFMMEHKFLSITLGDTIKVYLEKNKEIYSIDTYLCHGDLSNKNILLHKNQLVVIDWEDAFVGIEGYDFFYWLTFFDQREYYKTEEFKHFRSDEGKCKYIMLLVVALKCYLSLINNSYVINAISVESRLEEILDIFEEN